MKKNSVSVIIKRLLIYCLGMLIMAFGVTFAKTADVGMSPVNSIPYVLSEIFTSISMGTFVIVVYCVFIVVQFILNRGKREWWRLLQLPCTVIFGFFTDFSNWLLPHFIPAVESLTTNAVLGYVCQLIYLGIGIIILPFGMMMYMSADLPLLPGEGLTTTISEHVGKPMHQVKVYVDVTLALIALVIALLYFGGFHGVREGTILCALLYGRVLGLYQPIKKRVVQFVFGSKEEKA